MRRADVPKIYAIADRDALGTKFLPAAVGAMADAGIRWIQLRAKKTPGETVHRLAEVCLERLRGTGTQLWIDDRVDLAGCLPFFGVHLGQRDLPPYAAREVLGPGRRIGFSTHGAEEILLARSDSDVDLIAAGPVFPTQSKENPDPVLGLDGLDELRDLTTKPLVAIGGIDAERLPEVLDTGVDSAVVLGAACLPDPSIRRGEVSGRDLSKIYDGCRKLVRIAEKWN